MRMQLHLVALGPWIAQLVVATFFHCWVYRYLYGNVAHGF